MDRKIQVGNEEMEIVSSILRNRSSYLFDLLKHDEIKIETPYPMACRKVIAALMRGEKLSFTDLSLKEVLELLSEADRLNVTDTLIHNENLWHWLRGGKKMLVDLDWIKLFRWAKKHHNYQIGLHCVIYWLPHKERYLEMAKTPSDQNIVEKIIDAPELHHFAVKWNDHSHIILIREKD